MQQKRRRLKHQSWQRRRRKRNFRVSKLSNWRQIGLQAAEIEANAALLECNARIDTK